MNTLVVMCNHSGRQVRSRTRIRELRSRLFEAIEVVILTVQLPEEDALTCTLTPKNPLEDNKSGGVLVERSTSGPRFKVYPWQADPLQSEFFHRSQNQKHVIIHKAQMFLRLNLLFTSLLLSIQ